MNSQSLNTVIKGLSRQFGFVEAGITLPNKPDGLGSYLSWLSDGHAAGMTYLKRENAIAARENPCLLLPECRSILVLLARYPAPFRRDDQGIPQRTGKVAAYAMGEDYHVVLMDKLEQLAARLAEISRTRISYRAFTDSGPLLERELALKAGLGWIGRNSCLISPIHGSYTFLAELLTDLPLEPQSKLMDDLCGNCHRCVDACPTHCILPNRTIAAERCLSYLTIENRGEIPREIRASLGECIFGCDVCQEVCPWNQRVDNSNVDAKFLATDHIKTLDLVEELALSEADFKQVFHGSAILRAKRTGYLRNVALVIRDHPSAEARDALMRIIRYEREPYLRAAAVWAIKPMVDDRVEQELSTLLTLEEDALVLRELNEILGSVN